MLNISMQIWTLFSPEFQAVQIWNELLKVICHFSHSSYLPFHVLKYPSRLRCWEGRLFLCLNVKEAFLPLYHCNLCHISCSFKSRMYLTTFCNQSHLNRRCHVLKVNKIRHDELTNKQSSASVNKKFVYVITYRLVTRCWWSYMHIT